MAWIKDVSKAHRKSLHPMPLLSRISKSNTLGPSDYAWKNLIQSALQRNKFLSIQWKNFLSIQETCEIHFVLYNRCLLVFSSTSLHFFCRRKVNGGVWNKVFSPPPSSHPYEPHQHVLGFVVCLTRTLGICLVARITSPVVVFGPLTDYS